MATITIDHRLTRRAAQQIAGTLGFPSKMPGTSYGLPAQACKVGGKLRQVVGSTCEKCYAFDRGNYQFSGVKQSQAYRLASIENERWVEAMVSELTVTHARGKAKDGSPIASGWHRWHDSGDIQSVEHLAAICDVARLTPQLWHWLPTRELGFVKTFEHQGGAIPENLIIRVSATMIDGPATRAWRWTSTVHNRAPVANSAWRCPAPDQDNNCGPCRACWNRDVEQVTYHEH